MYQRSAAALQAVIVAPAAAPAAQAGLAQIAAEASRFGISNLFVLQPDGEAAPIGAAASALPPMRHATDVRAESCLLLDGGGMRETNLLALPLAARAAGKSASLAWAEDGPAGSAWLSCERLAALPMDGSIWQALARHPDVAKFPTQGRWLGRDGASGLVPRPAAFLDRDGVLIVDDGYPHDPAKVQWIPGVAAAIRQLNEAGYFVFVVTNQAGVARGYYPEEAVHRLHRWMAEALAASAAHIDAFVHCPHHPEAAVPAYRRVCHCRKPQPGMILDLMRTWPVLRPGSFLIGDRATDLAAAEAAGIPGYLFPSDNLADQVHEALTIAKLDITLTGG